MGRLRTDDGGALRVDTTTNHILLLLIIIFPAVIFKHVLSSNAVASVLRTVP